MCLLTLNSVLHSETHTTQIFIYNFELNPVARLPTDFFCWEKKPTVFFLLFCRSPEFEDWIAWLEYYLFTWKCVTCVHKSNKLYAEIWSTMYVEQKRAFSYEKKMSFVCFNTLDIKSFYKKKSICLGFF